MNKTIDEEFFNLLSALAEEIKDERKRAIFKMRFGIGQSQEPLTLKSIAEVFGLSRERIRQLLERSCFGLRNSAFAQIRKKEVKTRKKQVDKSATKFVLYLKEIVGLEEKDSIERLAAVFCDPQSILYLQSHFVELLLKLLYTKQQGSFYKSSLLRAIGEKLREEKRGKKFYSDFLLHIFWPKEIKKISDEEIAQLKAVRQPNYIGNNTIGKFFSDKLNREVNYESWLEREFLYSLELCDEVESYQEQPVSIFYKDGDRMRYYTPDVLIIFKNRTVVIVELKSQFYMPIYKTIVKGRVLWEFCKTKGFGMTITDGKWSIKRLQQLPVLVEFEKDVLKQVAEHPLNWDEYLKIKETHKSTFLDLAAVIIKNKLTWKLGKFRLEKQKPYYRYELCWNESDKNILRCIEGGKSL